MNFKTAENLQGEGKHRHPVCLHCLPWQLGIYFPREITVELLIKYFVGAVVCFPLRNNLKYIELGFKLAAYNLKTDHMIMAGSSNIV